MSRSPRFTPCPASGCTTWAASPASTTRPATSLSASCRRSGKAARGEARGYLLRDQGQPVAFAWCAARGSTLVYEVIGYRPELADRSPGTVLLYLILEDLFALGRYPVLDFGPGHAFYKEAFATRHTDFADAYLLRAGWGHRWRLWRIWSRCGQ